jgi:hypothetical protein
MQAQSPSDRLLVFLRACGFLVPDVSAEDLMITLSVATEHEVLPDDDKVLLRMATLTAAYANSLRDAMTGRVVLDAREEAILETALEYIQRKKSCAS